ncbi:Glutamate synthase [NADPH] large chain [Thioalkalivibrio nitratireducens DSM 14787]|uniref:Glutamate synthase [NADPH] large chain n=1 Tax=Thioalkalivibrio nitratireducens (strain DSM 14787 / UNIQEM 213 / ALEN2) TaxID=1255043 RepID=L0DXU0_THIND|nr:glutamate synthase-related protein [Thioalkalivibrio nitratireducens]AGA33196.1 Glutamate synthase [NADPH] large chain [Thioalkalivibrio nitratireducens DSM 14787]
MAKPIVAANQPKAVHLEQGREYYFCRCGRSREQPFCDGSHDGTGIEPLAFKAREDGEAWLCQCKQSKDFPYCDGSHGQVPDGAVGQVFEPESAAVDEDGDARAASEPQNTETEPHLEFVHALARGGLGEVGRFGPTVAMGVPRARLPSWDDIQILTAQLAHRPLADNTPVDTGLVIGPEARRPLRLEMPLLVTDMSFGSLSREAKVALARGAERAGTGICSGEGGMLPEEQAENSRYLFELGPARFGYHDGILDKVQAFHFKGGQAAKTGVGGVLPGAKVSDEIAKVRGIEPGRDAVSPPAIPDLETPEAFRRFAGEVRERTGGIPVGFKLSANHIEQDLGFALEAGADYVILDGRGGGTGASPALLRDHISVPTIPALARARHYLDLRGVSGRVTLIVTGGLRTPADFVKALALGADGIALGNSAIHAIGCVGARICHTNRCPSGVATHDPDLRRRLDPGQGAERLERFLTASLDLMTVLARAIGRPRLSDLSRDDLITFDRDLVQLANVPFAGVHNRDPD